MDCAATFGYCWDDGCQTQSPKLSVIEEIEDDSDDESFHVFNKHDY